MFTSIIDGHGFQMTFPSKNCLSVLWRPSKKVGPPGDERSSTEAEVVIFDKDNRFITPDYICYFTPEKTDDRFFQKDGTPKNAWEGLSVSDVSDISYILNREA